MWTDAFAQAGSAPAANPGLTMLLQLLQFAPIFLILYFLLIRPQQQRQKKQEQMLKEIKKGDRVVTSGGIIGTVHGVDDAKVVIRIADDVKVEFTKASIVQLLTAEAKT